jgi:hypothetical protein
MSAPNETVRASVRSVVSARGPLRAGAQCVEGNPASGFSSARVHARLRFRRLCCLARAKSAKRSFRGARIAPTHPPQRSDSSNSSDRSPVQVTRYRRAANFPSNRGGTYA